MTRTPQQNLLAVMITTTTYGTWLPGDMRGYVEDGRFLPDNPPLEARAKELLTTDPVIMSSREQRIARDALERACVEYDYQLFCACVQPWHLHWLVDCRLDPVATMVSRLKNAMRKALNRGRLWTRGYDKRYCFEMEQVWARYEYISRHSGFFAVREIG